MRKTPDTELAQRLGQLQPILAVFLLKRVGQRAPFGPTLTHPSPQCVPVLFGAFFLGLIFYLVFAIYGMSLFMGKFYTCNCEGEYQGETDRGFGGLT
jgi:hypothetical protein